MRALELFAPKVEKKSPKVKKTMGIPIFFTYLCLCHRWSLNVESTW